MREYNRRDFLLGASSLLAISSNPAFTQTSSIIEEPQTTQELYELFIKLADGELNEESFSHLSDEYKTKLAKSLHIISMTNAMQIAYSHVALEEQGIHNQGYVQYYMRDPRYMHGYANGLYTNQTAFDDNERNMGEPYNTAIQETGKLLMDTINESGKITNPDRVEEITDKILKEKVFTAGENISTRINLLLGQDPNLSPILPNSLSTQTPTIDL